MRLFSKNDAENASREHSKCKSIVEAGSLSPALLTVGKQAAIDKLFHPALLRFSIAFGSLLLVGGVSGASWGTAYVQAELAPKISQELGRAIKRPIQLGNIEQASWSGVRFGRSVLSATATDADRLVVQAVDIRFNPLQAIRNQKLKLTITLIQPTAFLDQDKTGKWLNLDLKFAANAPIEIEQIRLQDATVTLKPQRITSTYAKRGRRYRRHPWSVADIPTQMTLRRVNGQFSLRSRQRVVFEVTAQPHQQGAIKLKGELRSSKQFRLAVETHRLQIKALAPFLPTYLKLDAGVLDANLNLEAVAGVPRVFGTASVQQGAVRVRGETNPFSGISGDLQLQGEQVLLKRGQLWFGKIPFQLAGKVDLQHGFDLDARVPTVAAAPFMQTLKLKSPLPVQGALAADHLRLTGPLQHPLLSGTAQSVEPIKVGQLIMAAEGRFSLALAEDHLWLHEIRLRPMIGGTIAATAEAWLADENADIDVAVNHIETNALAKLYRLPELGLGQLNAQAKVLIRANQPHLTANWGLEGIYPTQGKVTFTNKRLQLRDTVMHIGDGTLLAAAELQPSGWQATLTSRQVSLQQMPVGLLSSHLPGQLEGQLALSGSTRHFSLATVQGNGQAELRFEQGTVAANLQAAEGLWQAEVSGAKLPLALFVAQSGDLSGQVKLQGQLTALSLAKTQAKGLIRVSERNGFVDKPINAKFNWNGKRLNIEQADTERIHVDGWVAPIFSENRFYGIGNLNLNVNVKDYNLAALPTTSDLPYSVKGTTSLQGTIRGTANAPQINASVQLDQFAIQGFQFQPLRGQVSTQPNQQIHLNLQGAQDQIALNLDSAYRPANFLVQLDQARAEGQFFGNRLLAQLENFSLEKLKLALAGLGVIRGKLNGTAEIDLTHLQQPIIKAVVNVSQPGISNIHTNLPDHANDRFTGVITYRDQTASLSEASLQLGSSHYRVAAQTQLSTARWSGQITTEQARLEDLLSLVTPADLAKLVRKVAPAIRLDAGTSAKLPSLSDLAALSGEFSGSALLHNSAQGIAIQFGLQGENWQLADYGIRKLTLSNARFDGKTFSFPTVAATGFAFALDGKSQQLNAQLNFAGQVAANALSGQMQLNGLTLSQIQSVFNLPLQLQGQVDIAATVSGNPEQPHLNGELHLQNVNVRDLPIEEAKVGFSYVNQQLHLESWQSSTGQAAASR